MCGRSPGWSSPPAERNALQGPRPGGFFAVRRASDSIEPEGRVSGIHRKLILLTLVNHRGIQYNKLVKVGRFNRTGQGAMTGAAGERETWEYGRHFISAAAAQRDGDPHRDLRYHRHPDHGVYHLQAYYAHPPHQLRGCGQGCTGIHCGHVDLQYDTAQYRQLSAGKAGGMGRCGSGGYFPAGDPPFPGADGPHQPGAGLYPRRGAQRVGRGHHPDGGGLRLSVQVQDRRADGV